ncbi:putative neural-cadherin 2 [Penaeus japonicus]|uniref:putative neural-cadherin 2 n=1 Tax=Penaeus japonicus TaxID=27405 RepID=UPI001C7157F0|nr:putative neural-cadherin 2 [Penaeus japonicus]
MKYDFHMLVEKDKIAIYICRTHYMMEKSRFIPAPLAIIAINMKVLNKLEFSLVGCVPARCSSISADLDSGRGGAEVWTAGSLDREEHRQLEVRVRVADAGGVTGTHVLTIIVDDINDNPMRPASKTVYLWKTQGGGSEAPLGRVYVDDPDDWDIGDKVFEWVGAPHPLFSLSRDTGAVFASSQVREGRYELRFSVSDTARGQIGVSANMTVTVKLLPPLAITHATPLTLTPITPTALTRGWSTTDGGGVLGKLVSGIQRALGKSALKIEIVSVHGTELSPPPLLSFDVPSSSREFQLRSDSSTHSSFSELSMPKGAPSSCVWMSVREPSGDFMDPVKLQGLLQLHSREVCVKGTCSLLTAGEARLEESV